ncbi:MAG: lytic transglycosylase domain-containing protein [Bryobacterales bacterium]|nr:lytic transglycosylase domain-containing protein [Bryobacterales bacterium]
MRRIFLLLFVVTLPHPWQETALAQGRQQVSLKTGFTLEVDRVEPDGESLVLHSGEGRIFVARSDVERVEDLPWVMPPAAALPEAETPPSVADLVRRSSAQHGLPEAFVRSVAEAESALQPQAVSPKGARGVMQLMPATAAALGVNPDEPAENIDGGAKLLRELLLRYQNQPDQVRLALAAYNAGAGAVAKYGGVPPYRETSAYVERVLRRYRARVASPRMEQDAGGGIRR